MLLVFWCSCRRCANCSIFLSITLGVCVFLSFFLTVIFLCVRVCCVSVCLCVHFNFLYHPFLLPLPSIHDVFPSLYLLRLAIFHIFVMRLLLSFYFIFICVFVFAIAVLYSCLFCLFFCFLLFLFSFFFSFSCGRVGGVIEIVWGNRERRHCLSKWKCF